MEYSKGVVKQQGWLLTQIKEEIIFGADRSNSSLKQRDMMDSVVCMRNWLYFILCN